jgi:hypothetical protein
MSLAENIARRGYPTNQISSTEITTQRQLEGPL